MAKQTESKTPAASPDVPGISIEIDKPEPIPVTLGDKVYRGFPPKTAGTFRAVKRIQEASDDPEKMLNEIENWLKSVFTAADAKKILARLEDPRDGLDMPHVIELLQKMMQSTKNPTM